MTQKINDEWTNRSDIFPWTRYYLRHKADENLKEKYRKEPYTGKIEQWRNGKVFVSRMKGRFLTWKTQRRFIEDVLGKVEANVIPNPSERAYFLRLYQDLKRTKFNLKEE